MAKAARDRGLEYIAITDHSESAHAARTVTLDALERQREEIARLREKYPTLTILHGLEVDIMPDGRLDFPDNVTTRGGNTLVLCEDNVNDNFLRGLTHNGRLFDIALNRLVSSTGTPRFNDEFAGATFSPDGHTLFVNIQASRGMTFAIWGPWGSIGV